MKLFPPSEEQQIIVNNISTSNVFVQAVAGSGKTTTILHIAKTYPNNKILVLTYNSKLKIETRSRVLNLNINNMETHSYHSFCVKYYSDDCYTDKKIIEILKKPIKKNETKFSYDLIIIDEAQDMTPLYYKLVIDILRRHEKIPRLCVLGDKMQNIFTFNNADSRYLTFCRKIFNINNYDWKYCTLSVSYRLNNNMSKFVNECMLHNNIINTCKDGPIVRYLMTNMFDMNFLINKINPYIKKYGCENIMVLTPSLNTSSKSPIKIFENYLSNKLKYNIYVPKSDNDNVNNKLLKNKIMFSTFHQCKGLERKVVIVFNFDNSYFKFYAKDRNENICTNELYVACTRSTDYLILLQNINNDPLKFINFNLVKSSPYVRIIKNNGYYRNNDIINQKKPHFGASDISKFLPSTVLDRAEKLINIKTIQNSYDVIKIFDISKQKDTYESMSDITGKAIPAYFEYIRTGDMIIHSNMVNDENKIKLLKKYENVNLLSLHKLSIKKLLMICTIDTIESTGYISRLNQINWFNWISNDIMVKCMCRMDDKIGINCEFEKFYSYQLKIMNKIIDIDCSIDCIDHTNKIVWEFKCVEKIMCEHLIQLSLYSYILQECNLRYKNYKFNIFNIFSNEILQISFTDNNCTSLFNYLINQKFSERNDGNNKNFVKRNIKYREKILNRKMEK